MTSPANRGIALKYFLESGRLADFTEALAHAIYDRGIEAASVRTPAIRYYYDADVMVRTICGFRSEPRKESERQVLTRALLSAGYLGTAHLLRPHAAELHKVISELDETTEGPYSDGVIKYLQRRGVDQDFRTLLDAIRRGKTEEEKTQFFVEALREVGPDAFVALEATYGSWPERLRLLGRSVLRFTDFGPEIGTMLNTSEVWRIYGAISAQRMSGRPVPVINDLADAVALVSLHRLIEESKVSTKLPAVRFHTNTAALHKVARTNPEVTSLLSYEVPQHFRLERAWRSGMVLRTSDYFILRACFEALRFPEVELADEGGPPPVTILELERVLRELTKALKPDEVDLTQRDLAPAVIQELERLQIGDHHLVDVIAEMERSSFLERLFTRYRPPAVLKDVVTDSVEVFEFMETGRPRVELRREIVEEAEGLKRELAYQVTGFYDRLQFIREIRVRVDALIAAALQRQADFVVTLPLRDLGIVRWGGTIRDSDLEDAKPLVDDLFSGDQARVMGGCSTLARTASEPLDESKCLVICSVLSMLSLWHRVILAINDYERLLGHSQLEPSLAILRTAAHARVGPPFSEPEKTARMDALREMIADSPTKQQGRLYIGLAYTAFYISVNDKEIIPAEGGDPSVDIHKRAPWAVMSYEYGEHAFDLLDNDDRLGMAFANNHCAYVGAKMNLFLDRTATYLERLKMFESDVNIWHYRFADTVAVTEYQQAVTEWEAALAAPNKGEGMKPQVCERLRKATEMLTSHLPRFGDPEIIDHLANVEKLRAYIGCGIFDRLGQK